MRKNVILVLTSLLILIIGLLIATFMKTGKDQKHSRNTEKFSEYIVSCIGDKENLHEQLFKKKVNALEESYLKRRLDQIFVYECLCELLALEGQDVLSFSTPEQASVDAVKKKIKKFMSDDDKKAELLYRACSREAVQVANNLESNRRAHKNRE